MADAVKGEVGVDTLRIRSVVVVGVMPKRRKDSAIWSVGKGLVSLCYSGRKQEGEWVEEEWR